MEPTEALVARQRKAADLLGKGLAWMLTSILVFFLSMMVSALLHWDIPMALGVLFALTFGSLGALDAFRGLTRYIDARRDMRRFGMRIPQARLLR